MQLSGQRTGAAFLGALVATLTPAASAHAAGGGGRLLVFFFALPVLLPLIGSVVAAIGLPRSAARGLWVGLCAVLTLNAALLGVVIGEELGTLAVALAMLQVVYGLTLVLTRRPESRDNTWPARARRALVVVACGAAPAWLAVMSGS